MADIDRMPTSAQLWCDRLMRPRSRRRYTRLPNIAATVFNVAAMSSQSHQRLMRDKVDLGFRPDVSGVGMLQWKRFNEVIQIGLDHARGIMSAPDCPAAQASWCAPPRSRRWS
jgi:NTE family protein